MTSKEALEKLLHLHICYDCTADKDCCKTCDSRLCYEAVKKDLEVLEILKGSYKAVIKEKNKSIVNDMDLVGADDIKIKEWLKQ